MGFDQCVSGMLGKFRELSVTLAAAVIISGMAATGVFAGDVSDSADSLSVTGATAGILPQAGSPSGEGGLLSGLHISGYLQQIFGMW
jgi:hypothetical protein